jgi:hypothetical protein
MEHYRFASYHYVAMAYSTYGSYVHGVLKINKGSNKASEESNMAIGASGQ